MRENWTYKKLGEVAEIVMGQSPAGASINENTGIEFHQGKVFFGEKYLAYSDSKTSCPTKLAKAHSVLLCVRAPVGIVNITERDICIGRGLCAINGKDATTDFLFYALLSKRPYFEANSTGSTFKAISSSIVKNALIPVPSPEDQQRIVKELDTIHAILDKKNEQLRELDNLAQAIFVDMFGNPLHNDKGWETKNLGDLSITIANGYNAKLEPDTYKTEGIPYFRCQNIWWNRIDVSDLVYINEQTNEKMKSSSLKKNDLIISKIGRVYTENSSLGRTAIYEGEDFCANLSGNLCFVRLKDTICPKFVLSILTFEEYRKWAMKNTPGGIDKRAMSVGQISKFPIILPPLPLQQEFAKRIEAIERQKELLRGSITETETLLAARMQYYFE